MTNNVIPDLFKNVLNNMKLQTYLSLFHAEVETPLVALPARHGNMLTVGTVAPSGHDLNVIATLNLEGRDLSPARRSTVLRMLQALGEAVAINDGASLKIIDRVDGPLRIPLEASTPIAAFTCKDARPSAYRPTPAPPESDNTRSQSLSFFTQRNYEINP